MEEWDIYNVDRIKTNKIVQRGSVFNPDEFHLVVHVCIINSKNQLLIQLRQPTKKSWPNLWDVGVGGNAHKGENSYQAAERETLEEIGYPLELSSKRPSFTINFQRGFDDFYLINADLDISELKLQTSEVKAVKWASKDDIRQMIDKKEFINYHFSIIDMIFDMKDHYGAHVMPS